MPDGGNVLINGRTAVHAGSCGTLTTIDVCYTKIGKPVKEIAYTNIAKSADAAGTAGSVLINGNPVCHRGSNFAKSTGDEPGDHFGVLSGTIMAQADFITFSSNVFFEGMEATRQSDLMVSNNKNTAPMPLMQPGGPPPAALKKAEAQNRAATDSPFKIAVEIAGATPQNMKGSLVAKRGSFFRDVPLGSTARTDGHRRELVLENLPDGSYDLILNFFDNIHGACQIPLGQGVSTCGKEKESAEWDTVLVPVLPRVFITAESDRVETAYPRCDMESKTGWLYVYLDGRLWREMQVLPEGGVQDVNLTYEKGRTRRRATSASDYVLVLPYKVQGRQPLIEMCYSEVQWDWARIDAMGGLAEDDPRQSTVPFPPGMPPKPQGACERPGCSRSTFPSTPDLPAKTVPSARLTNFISPCANGGTSDPGTTAASQWSICTTPSASPRIWRVSSLSAKKGI